MPNLPNCPKCESEYCYEDNHIIICPECFHEFTSDNLGVEEDAFEVFDANGNKLVDGDDVIVIKDLKVKGASMPVKMGTKVRDIKLVDKDHNIDCNIKGFGAMSLKSEFVKKA